MVENHYLVLKNKEDKKKPTQNLKKQTHNQKEGKCWRLWK